MSTNDFGFTTHTEDEISGKFSEKDYQDRLKKLESLIMPLLDNLIKTSDQEIIKWPNRKLPLQTLKSDIQKLTK